MWVCDPLLNVAPHIDQNTQKVNPEAAGAACQMWASASFMVFCKSEWKKKKKKFNLDLFFKIQLIVKQIKLWNGQTNASD